MFKKTAIVAGIGLAISATAQADYQWELGGAYSMGEYSADVKNNSVVGGNKSKDIDEDIGTLFGTYYLENVDTSKGPLRQAAFLDHASDITIFARDGDVDLNSLDRNLEDQDGQSYGISSRYVAEGPGWKLSGWLMDLGFERREPADKEVDNYTIGIGKYLTPNTTLVFDYNKINVNNGNDTDSYGGDLAHFFAMSSGGIKANVGAGKLVINNGDDVESYDIGATWYINNNIGFGGGYENTSQDGGQEVDRFFVNADWFITESFAMDLTYGQANFDDQDISAANGGGKLELENEFIRLGAALRF